MGRPYLFSNFSYIGNIFDILDLDGSGTIEKEEFRQLIKQWDSFQMDGSSKLFPSYLSKLIKVAFGFVFHLIDADSSASLDEGEFERFYNAWIRSLFDSMDEDGNGSVSISELHKILQAVLETTKQQTLKFAQVLQVMSFMDDNSNGEIEYNEYETLIRPFIDLQVTMILMLNKYQKSNPSENAWNKYEDYVYGILEKLL